MVLLQLIYDSGFDRELSSPLRIGDDPDLCTEDAYWLVMFVSNSLWTLFTPHGDQTQIHSR